VTGRNEILVGVDGCPSSDAAVIWAAGEAASRGTGLMLVHALDMNSAAVWGTTKALRNALREIAQPIIDRAVNIAAEHQPSVPVRGRVLIGSPTGTLLLLSGTAALTVVGRTGHGALALPWIGTVTQRVLAHASSPAVAVGCLDAAAAGTVSRIVVAMSAGPAEGAALEFAFSEAQRRCVPLEAIHVLARRGYPARELVDDPYPEYLDAEERQAEVLNEWRASYPGVAVSSIVRSGHLGDVFAEACRPNDLLVLGHHRSAPCLPHHLGSAANSALRHAACAVAVVHEPTANVSPLTEQPARQSEGAR
jgi:nucleotide-binding universal stress UspA family protein